MVKWLKETIQFLNGFRKFTIMFMLIMIGVAFRVTNQINGSEFVDLVSNAAVAFFAANAGEHMTKAVTEWVKKKK